MPVPKQYSTKKVKFEQIMANKYFKIGMNDFHTKTWRDFWGHDHRYSWCYERGRQFAAITKIRHLTMSGFKVDEDLIELFKEHKRSGAIL